MATLRCRGSMFSPPSRSAIVRATFRMRSCVRAGRGKLLAASVRIGQNQHDTNLSLRIMPLLALRPHAPPCFTLMPAPRILALSEVGVHSTAHEVLNDWLDHSRHSRSAGY